MKITDVSRVCEEFAKRLSIPTKDNLISFDVSSGDDVVEMNLIKEGNPVCSLSIDTKNIRVLYTERYKSDDYVAIQYNSSITLTYYLCVFTYRAFFLNAGLTFNDMLSLLFEDEVNEWQDVARVLAENISIPVEDRDGTLYIGGVDISYSDGHFTYSGVNMEIEDTYTGILDAIFLIVEYVANLTDQTDDLFLEPEEVEEDNLLTDEGEEMGPGGAPDIDIENDFGDLDDLLSDEEGPGDVEPMPNEDFSEPVSAVVTPEDVM